MKRIILFFSVFAFVCTGFSQETFEELIKQSPKKMDKALFVWAKDNFRPDPIDGLNIHPDLSKAEIKRIALVSFTISIPNTISNKYLTGEGNKYFVNKMYDMGINDIKEEFLKAGIEVLSIDQMTDFQKSVLNGTATKDDIFSTTLGLKKAKLYDKYEDVDRKGVEAGAAADGYQEWIWEREGLPVSWDMNVYGALCHSMEVDGILFVNNMVSLEKKSLSFNKVIMTLIGPNPIPKKEGKMYPGLSYIHGMPYGQTALNGEIEIATFKKKQIISENFEGYNKVLGLLAGTIVKYLDINRERSIKIAEEKQKKMEEKAKKKGKK